MEGPEGHFWVTFGRRTSALIRKNRACPGMGPNAFSTNHDFRAPLFGKRHICYSYLFCLFLDFCDEKPVILYDVISINAHHAFLKKKHEFWLIFGVVLL